MPNTQPYEVKKKVYTKPKLTEVRLAAQESVLALCKTGGGIGLQSLCGPDLNCVNTFRS
jgi:hypothetical protein